MPLNHSSNELAPDPARHTLMFKRRGVVGGLLLFPFVLAVLLDRPLVPHGALLDHAFDAAAWMLFLAFFVFRIWATMYIGDRKDQQLQMEGPYSMTRNPLYLGSACFALSAAFFLKSFTLILAAALLGLIYRRFVIPSEERVLERKFGEDFRKYRARVPRLFPNPRLYHASESVPVRLAGMRREFKRLLPHALLPFGALLLAHLRSSPWWPACSVFP